jgi:hypothetical protein
MSRLVTLVRKAAELIACMIRLHPFLIQLAESFASMPDSEHPAVSLRKHSNPDLDDDFSRVYSTYAAERDRQ